MPTSTESTAPAPRDIRILVAIGVRFYRDGLTDLLKQVGGLVIAAATEDFEGTVTQAATLAPDVVLLDIALAENLAIARALFEIAPACHVIVLGLQESEEEFIQYAEAGIAGYVPRGASMDQLVGRIRGAVRGEFNCPPGIAASLLRHIARTSAGSPAERPRLTPRELRVLALIGEGLSNKEIAVQLNIEVSTVKNHVHRVLEKLNVSGRGRAASIARSFLASTPV